MLKIHNTISNLKEDFTPHDQSNIRMYVCGPTVYSRPHLGNMRSIVVYDVIYRFLKHCYPSVTYVRNITDVDDKILNASKENGSDPIDLAKRVEQMFKEDCNSLFCLTPTIEPRATEEIGKMIEIIDLLIQKGYAYISDSGDIFFSVEKHAEYGKLSNRKLEEMFFGVRILVNESKRHPGDFILWKLAPEGDFGWKTKFGYGRPGWHIECSAMSSKYLGNDFDIHGGGADLQFPHHENEIAQSVCAYEGSSFAKYWIHNGFLTVDGEKMSKSIGNIITVADLIKKEIDGEVIRFALLSTHYRKPMDMNDELLLNAKMSLDKFYTVLLDNEYDDNFDEVPTKAKECLYDDFNTSKYFALMFSYCKDIKDTKHDKNRKDLVNHFYAMGRLIGIFNKKPSEWFVSKIDPEVEKLILERAAAKKNKDYKMADLIRDKIVSMGYEIEDGADGKVNVAKKFFS